MNHKTASVVGEASEPKAFGVGEPCEHIASDVPWRNKVAIGVIPDKNGYIEVPNAPGLGIDIDVDEIARHPVKATEAYNYSFRTPEQIQRTR